MATAVARSKRAQRRDGDQGPWRRAERFRLVVESAPNAMVMVNRQGMIEMINTQAEQVFGYARTELVGQSVNMLIPTRFRDAHPAMHASFFTEPRSRPMGAGRDLYALKKDGSEFPVEIGLNLIETDKGIVVLSAIVDISDRKQKERQIVEALKEKDVLIGEIHHRVKNNMQIVHSLLGLQLARTSNSVVADMLRDAQNRIYAMSLIHQTLYQSKNFARLDFKSVLDSLVSNLTASYGPAAKHVAVSTSGSEVLLPLDIAIPCGLVANELISNALRHAFRDEQHGRISVTLNLNEDDHAVLVVSDDGVGIPADVDPERTSTLGLQLVWLLADQVKASISIQRANPTRFALRLPLRPLQPS